MYHLTIISGTKYQFSQWLAMHGNHRLKRVPTLSMSKGNICTRKAAAMNNTNYQWFHIFVQYSWTLDSTKTSQPFSCHYMRNVTLHWMSFNPISWTQLISEYECQDFIHIFTRYLPWFNLINDSVNHVVLHSFKFLLSITSHDYVINGNIFYVTEPFVRRIHWSPVVLLTKASDAEL